MKGLFYFLFLLSLRVCQLQDAVKQYCAIAAVSIALGELRVLREIKTFFSSFPSCCQGTLGLSYTMERISYETIPSVPDASFVC